MNITAIFYRLIAFGCDIFLATHQSAQRAGPTLPTHRTTSALRFPTSQISEAQQPKNEKGLTTEGVGTPLKPQLRKRKKSLGSRRKKSFHPEFLLGYIQFWRIRSSIFMIEKKKPWRIRAFNIGTEHGASDYMGQQTHHLRFQKESAFPPNRNAVLEPTSQGAAFMESATTTPRLKMSER